MMGTQDPPQPSLFYTRFNLDQRIPRDHPLRRLDQTVDFTFVYDEVESLYGAVGNESVPPPVILKLMLLLTLENVPSERRLMQTLPMRLDWLWFLGLDLDSSIPDHSVLSKARKRWGVGLFREVFERVVRQCVEAGLVDGRKIFCDSSLIEANASQKSIERVGVVDLSEITDEMERRLEEFDPESAPEAAGLPGMKATSRSTTDPEAAVVRKRGGGPARARYKTHRAIDTSSGVITATVVTSGDVNDAHVLPDLVDQHEATTGSRVQVTVADTLYGTAENYLHCIDRGIAPHMQPMKSVVDRTVEKFGRFPSTSFRFDAQTDTYTCPAGKPLRRLQARPDRNGVRYGANPFDCQACSLRDRCTTASRRTLVRRDRSDELERIHQRMQSRDAIRDLRRRKYFMEGSFAEATRFGFKRCRWRGHLKTQIQDLLVAISQNLTILLRYGTSNEPTPARLSGNVPTQYTPILAWVRRTIKTLLSWLFPQASLCEPA